MPFNNEDKIPFKDLPVCHQQEIIDVLTGKNTDCDTYFYYTGTNWLKQTGGREAAYFNTIYKVVQKDIIIDVPEQMGYSTTAYNFAHHTVDICKNIEPGKYKLVKIEE